MVLAFIKKDLIIFVNGKLDENNLECTFKYNEYELLKDISKFRMVSFNDGRFNYFTGIRIYYTLYRDDQRECRMVKKISGTISLEYQKFLINSYENQLKLVK